MNKYEVKQSAFDGAFYVMRNGIRYGKPFLSYEDASMRRDALKTLQNPIRKTS